jgi:hypothetical protein
MDRAFGRALKNDQLQQQGETTAGNQYIRKLLTTVH